MHKKGLLDILFWFNPNHYKLDKQELINTEKNQHLKIVYTSYMKIEDAVFPKRIEISAIEKEKRTTIHIDYKTVVFKQKFLNAI